MFQAPRGTSDLLPEEQHYWRYIESKAVALAGRYGFHRIDTPAFEDSNLFIRSVGEGTDIVEKEMYTFDDLGDYDRGTLSRMPENPQVMKDLKRGIEAFKSGRMVAWDEVKEELGIE